jgi:hypothetical protein
LGGDNRARTPLRRRPLQVVRPFGCDRHRGKWLRFCLNAGGLRTGTTSEKGGQTGMSKRVLEAVERNNSISCAPPDTANLMGLPGLATCGMKSDGPTRIRISQWGTGPVVRSRGSMVGHKLDSKIEPLFFSRVEPRGDVEKKGARWILDRCTELNFKLRA